MKICNKCILNDNYPDIAFNEAGTCSFCVKERTYTPLGEDKLLEIIQKARMKNCSYDALVPLSGGKDSTYILHLAVNVYKLKVLAMTYDNGLFSPMALDNIQQAIKITKVKHIMCKPDSEVQKKIYRNMFLNSGDICGACDIGTKANILKVAQDFSVPIILYGTSPLEEDSFIPDSIQDIARFKYILKNTKDLSQKEISDFLIYPNLNLFLLSYYKKTGKFGKEVRPLFYIDNPTDKEMGDIIAKELNWKEDNSREYSKHFDCIAEPLTNYVRNEIYGYERRICQYSNMVRRNEISREKALELYKTDNIISKPDNYKDVLKYLNLTEEDLQKIITIPKLKYEKHTSKLNRLFSGLMKIKQMINSCLIVIVLLAVLSSCEKDEVYTGSLKVTHTNHPSDLTVHISPAENSDFPITDWITPGSDGTFTYNLNAGNYILTSSSSTFFPKVGFQIKVGETTEIIFDSGNSGHVK